jgi:hypothetical protein
MRDESGQATVEFLALVPLAGVVITAVLAIGACAAARIAADQAAHAAAVASIEGSDPVGAARSAVPDWSKGLVSVRATSAKVEVEVRPSHLPYSLASLVAAKSVLMSSAGHSR